MTRVVVTVVSRDEIYLNKERFDIPALSDKLAELKEAGSTGQGEIQRTIVLEGDREIPYRLLIEVLDVLRKNGYRAVNLKTSKLTGD